MLNQTLAARQQRFPGDPSAERRPATTDLKELKSEPGMEDRAPVGGAQPPIIAQQINSAKQPHYPQAVRPGASIPPHAFGREKQQQFDPRAQEQFRELMGHAKKPPGASPVEPQRHLSMHEQLKAAFTQPQDAKKEEGSRQSTPGVHSGVFQPVGVPREAVAPATVKTEPSETITSSTQAGKDAVPQQAVKGKGSGQEHAKEEGSKEEIEIEDDEEDEEEDPDAALFKNQTKKKELSSEDEGEV